MKIVLDISPLAYGTGVSMYCRELTRALSRLDHENQYILFAGAFRNANFFQSWFTAQQFPNNFQLKTVLLPPKLQLYVWNQMHILPIEMFVGAIDVYHSLDWSLAPATAPTILTVHDLFFLKHPELQQHPYRTALEKRLITARQRQLPVIAVSETTKSDLIELQNYPQHLITVIYEALPEVTASHSQPGIENLRSKYGFGQKYFLSVATQEPRKNLSRLIEAFSIIPEQDISLVIVGKAGWGSESTKKDHRVMFTGYIPDEELESLRRHAMALVYPSLYEGFGLPILEGFSSKIPVITSNNSSMQEIAADAAILINPYEPASITDGLLKILRMSEQDRNNLVTRGQQQLSKFSWNTTAKQTMSLYKQSYEEKNHRS